MKKKLLFSVCAMFVVMCLISISYSLLKEQRKSEVSNENKVRFLSVGFSDSKMKQTADIVALGKVTGIKDKVKKDLKAKGVDGSEFFIKNVSAITYNISLSDSLKNINNEKDIQLTMTDGSSVNFEIGKEYLFYLYKHEKAPEHVYSLVSYDKGVFEVVNNEITIGKNKVKLSDFKVKFNKD